jgi:hypothetical protein
MPEKYEGVNRIKLGLVKFKWRVFVNLVSWMKLKVGCLFTLLLIDPPSNGLPHIYFCHLFVFHKKSHLTVVSWIVWYILQNENYSTCLTLVTQGYGVVVSIPVL